MIPAFLLDGTMAEIDISGSYSIGKNNEHWTIYNNGKRVQTQRLNGRDDVDKLWNGRVVQINQYSTIGVSPEGYREKWLQNYDSVFGKNKVHRYTLQLVKNTNKGRVTKICDITSSYDFDKLYRLSAHINSAIFNDPNYAHSNNGKNFEEIGTIFAAIS